MDNNRTLHNLQVPDGNDEDVPIQQLMILSPPFRAWIGSAAATVQTSKRVHRSWK